MMRDSMRRVRWLLVWLLASGALTLATASLAQPTLEERLELLEAREQIRELIYAYGHALDHRDFVAFSELFAEETGTWVGGFGSATGREEIFELMDGMLGHADPPVEPTSHHVFTNIRISVEGASASATTKWIFVVPSETGAPRWQFLGHYEDLFVREDGQWRFARREAFTDLPAQ